MSEKAGNQPENDPLRKLLVTALLLLPAMLDLTADRDACKLLDHHADRMVEAVVAGEGIHLDVDTPDALVALSRLAPTR